MAVRIIFEIFTLTCVVVAVTCSKNELNRLACPPNKNQQQPVNRVNTTIKLAAIRKLIKQHKFDAILVSSGDEHQSEMISDYDKRRQYISGFSGTNGDAIITLNKAALWTDGRYYSQADEELDCNWLLIREDNKIVHSKSAWLQQQFPDGGKIGADPKLVPAFVWTILETELKSHNKQFTLVEMHHNLVDLIREKSLPEKLKSAYILGDHYTGKSWNVKISETLQELAKLKAEAMIITALDEIAWLLNIRGWDIPYTGFLKSYVFLNPNYTILYVGHTKVQGNVTNFFEKHRRYQLKFKPYKKIFSDLPFRVQDWNKILVPSRCGFAPGASKKIHSLIPECKLISKPSPVIYLKARKNPTEVFGMIKAHIRDGAALCKFFHYFKSSIDNGQTWDELKVAAEVDRFRLEQPLLVVPSFPTIAAFGPHGAHPHYLPTTVTSRTIYNNSTLVIDSGGQYYDGTTDVTRTLHLGHPTKEEKEAYTRVLMGSIELSSLIFPNSLDTSGIDAIARAPIWNKGYDYNYGTGHGIGAFLNVHESPITVNYKNWKDYSEQFQEGYFLSNEPGIYIEGNFGIRLENIMRVVKHTFLKQDGVFLGFEDVTLVPYDYKLINFDFLNVNHKRWLNHYNVRIRRLVGKELKKQNATDARKWMFKNTTPIPDIESVDSDNV